MPTIFLVFLTIVGVVIALLSVVLVIALVRMSKELRKIEKSQQRAIMNTGQRLDGFRQILQVGILTKAFLQRKMRRTPEKEHNTMTKETKGGGKFVLGAAIGAVAGVITGFLTAPKSGKETRADIKQKAGEVKETVAKSADDLKEKAVSLKDRIAKR